MAAAAAASGATAVAGAIGQSVIPIVNRLQDIFAQLGSGATIELPQVAVVGSQSSGKSSVLEALVGRDFLPRGTDICTRRPLVLQLVNSPRRHASPDGSGAAGSEGNDEWGEFLHHPGKRFYDFSEIRREIQEDYGYRLLKLHCELERLRRKDDDIMDRSSSLARVRKSKPRRHHDNDMTKLFNDWLAETDREAGGNKGVSDKQIRLKIFSPNVLNITLVDLPGITKVPVGDQPSDIETRIRTMILSYIKHETCVILAVSPANADLANSDALQMARIADPDGSRTIGVITKLDIMDKGTDACNFLLGNVIPLRLGYVGVVNRSQQDINLSRSIKDALAYEENFFRTHPVYHGLAHCCGVPQLAKKLNQILVQHIKAVLPGLRSRVNSQLVAVAKEYASYGDIVDSKAGQGVVLLNILSKFCEAFSSMVEGKNDEMSTSELSGGARIHYIFQSIFVKSLEEVDPCCDVTDDDIRMAIQNASGPKGALFVPEVPFEVLVKRQIGRLLDPSLQCLDFVYDELVKMSHRCLATELQRFPYLRNHLEGVIYRFLKEGRDPAERIIAHIIEMEMDYINTSHPNFIGGNKALEAAQQQVKSSRLSASVHRSKDEFDSDKLQASEKSSKSRAILARPGANGNITDQGARPVVDSERPVSTGNRTGSTWGFSSIFGSSENRGPVREPSVNKSVSSPVDHVEQSLSIIQLREPPIILKPSENQTEQEVLEIAITKLLLKSYYDIVNKNIEDLVPKAIMHFLVNHTKRELHNVLIRSTYREDKFDELLREPDDIATTRKRVKETLRVLQQANKTLEELPLEAETIEKGYNVDTNPFVMPKTHRFPTSFYSTNGGFATNAASPNHPKSRKSAHSGEQPSPIHPYSESNGSGYYSEATSYPIIEP